MREGVKLLSVSESQVELGQNILRKKGSRKIANVAIRLTLTIATTVLPSVLDCKIQKAEASAILEAYPHTQTAWDCSQTYGSATWCEGSPPNQYSMRGYTYRNCTDGAAFWAQYYLQQNISGYGNAADWDTAARSRNIITKAGSSNDVEQGDIAQSEDSVAPGVGHVGFVTEVEKDSSGTVIKIRVAEMNKMNTGLQTHDYYASKNNLGNFSRSFGSQDWDSFIDLNGPGLGLFNQPTGLAQPETSGFGDPKGNIDAVNRIPGGVRVSGWAFDPDTPSTPINVDIYGGDGYASSQNYRAGVYANELNTLVGNAFGIDPYKGFTRDFSSPTGQQHLCIYGINTQPNGTTRRNDCYDMTVSGQSIGNLDTGYRVPGGARYEGWAIDPDTGQSIDVHLFESDTADPAHFLGGTNASVPCQDVVTALRLTTSIMDQITGFQP